MLLIEGQCGKEVFADYSKLSPRHSGIQLTVACRLRPFPCRTLARAKNGLVGAERVNCLGERTTWRSLAQDNVEEPIGLSNEQIVAFERRARFVVPVVRRVDLPTPTLRVGLESYRAACTDDCQRRFVGGLMLVHTVRCQNLCVSSDHVDRVFHIDSCEYLVTAIRSEPVDGADKPLAGVDHVR